LAKRRARKKETSRNELSDDTGRVSPSVPNRPAGSQNLSAAHSDNEANLDELGSDPGQVGPDSAGQSGDTQGLSDIAEAEEESVEELVESDQAFEAEVAEGVEEAGDEPERPVHTREDWAQTDDYPFDRDETDQPD